MKKNMLLVALLCALVFFSGSVTARMITKSGREEAKKKGYSDVDLGGCGRKDRNASHGGC